MTNILEVKDLHVNIKDKEILKGINLTLELGKVYALMGPNGSGKSTLANALMGNPNYIITKGQIILNGEDITEASPDKRAKLGLFLSFQYPSEIPGITIVNFLKEAYNAVKDEKVAILDFKKLLEKKAEQLDIKKEFLMRSLNEGFSGGEKKKTEILQMAALDPKISILDETDSGLDIDAIRVVAAGVNRLMNKNKTIFIITHYKRILNYIKPNKIFVMYQGRIVSEGDPELVDKLEAEGYGELKGLYEAQEIAKAQ